MGTKGGGSVCALGRQSECALAVEGSRSCSQLTLTSDLLLSASLPCSPSDLQLSDICLNNWSRTHTSTTCWGAAQYMPHGNDAQLKCSAKKDGVAPFRPASCAKLLTHQGWPKHIPSPPAGHHVQVRWNTCHSSAAKPRSHTNVHTLHCTILSNPFPQPPTAPYSPFPPLPPLFPALTIPMCQNLLSLPLARTSLSGNLPSPPGQIAQFLSIKWRQVNKVEDIRVADMLFFAPKSST